MQIILNRRSNSAQWDRSIRATLIPVISYNCLFNTLPFSPTTPSRYSRSHSTSKTIPFKARFESCSQKI